MIRLLHFKDFVQSCGEENTLWIRLNDPFHLPAKLTEGGRLVGHQSLTSPKKTENPWSKCFGRFGLSPLFVPLKGSIFFEEKWFWTSMNQFGCFKISVLFWEGKWYAWFGLAPFGILQDFPQDCHGHVSVQFLAAEHCGGLPLKWKGLWPRFFENTYVLEQECARFIHLKDQVLRSIGHPSQPFARNRFFSLALEVALWFWSSTAENSVMLPIQHKSCNVGISSNDTLPLKHWKSFVWPLASKWDVWKLKI